MAPISGGVEAEPIAAEDSPRLDLSVVDLAAEVQGLRVTRETDIVDGYLGADFPDPGRARPVLTPLTFEPQPPLDACQMG